MNPTANPPLDGFEQRLLGELREFVELRAASQMPNHHRVSQMATPRRGLSWRHHWTRPAVLSGASLTLAAAVAATVLALGATTNTPPAWALTRQADGSVTLTIRDLTRGIPALNAKLHELGIDETVIPVTTDCNSPDGSGPVAMTQIRSQYNGSLSLTYTKGQGHPPAPGFHYVLAAYRLPNGKFLGFMRALKAPLPSCLPLSN